MKREFQWMRLSTLPVRYQSWAFASDISLLHRSSVERSSGPSDHAWQDLADPYNGKTIFHAMPQPFEATRYHSLIVERQSLPDTFEITAETSEGEIMGLRHRPTGAEGVQFHLNRF